MSGQYRLLLIAISDYEALRPLQGPRRDAEALKAVLFGRYGFTQELTTELRDRQATSRAIIQAMKTFKTAPPEDHLLVYYAGHGYTDKDFDRTGYWLPCNASGDKDGRENWLATTVVRGALLAIPCRHILLVCDSCFSGSLLDETRDLEPNRPADFIEVAARYRSREVLTSGLDEPVADSSLGGHSPFAFHLIETLKTMPEQWVDPVRLYDHVRRGVTGQTPLYGPLNGSGHERGGAFILWNRGADRQVESAPQTQPTRLQLNPVSPTTQVTILPEPVLHVETTPSGASLKVDGHVIGKSPLRLALRAGEYRVRAEMDSYKPWDRRIRFEAKADARLRIELERKHQAFEAWFPMSSEQAVDVQRGAADALGMPLTMDLACGEGLKLRLILIPAGNFLMGSPGSEKGRSRDEGPQHAVAISKPFYIGVYPVTQGQYEGIIGRNPSFFNESQARQAKQDDGHERPVEQVDWDDAAAFCEKALEQTGRKLRLPTEVEWEYACRAGSQTQFFFGDDPKLLAEYAWFSENGGGVTHPVGLKRPNVWGLYDMIGNVYEWCSNWYSPYGEDADSLQATRVSTRVLRGGYWGGGPEVCRSANRGGNSPGNRRNGLGFRVVMDLDL